MFSFVPLIQNHFPLLHKWMEHPHVSQWWGEGRSWSFHDVQEKYHSYTFHQIGLIYSVDNLHASSTERKSSLKHDWVDIRILKKEEVSPFVWGIIQALASSLQ